MDVMISTVLGRGIYFEKDIVNKLLSNILGEEILEDIEEDKMRIKLEELGKTDDYISIVLTECHDFKNIDDSSTGIDLLKQYWNLDGIVNLQFLYFLLNHYISDFNNKFRKEHESYYRDESNNPLKYEVDIFYEELSIGSPCVVISTSKPSLNKNHFVHMQDKIEYSMRSYLSNLLNLTEEDDLLIQKELNMFQLF